MTIVAPVPVEDGPALPSSNDQETTFDAAFELFLAWLKATARPGMNALAAATYTNAQDGLGSATSALGYRNEANSSRNAAASSAGTAAQAAQDAAAAATTAIARAAQALSSLQSIGRLYLGFKNAGPATDNDGNPLVAGASYYDTTLTKVRCWSGTGWVDGITAVAPNSGGDMLKSIYDTNNSGVVDTAESVPWTGVTGRPTIGTAASKDTGTSGNAVPVLNAANTWSALQRFNSGLGIGIDALAALHIYAANAGTPTTAGTVMTGVTARIQNSSVAVDIGAFASGTSFIQPRLAADHSQNFDLYLNPNGGSTRVGKTVIFPAVYDNGNSGAAKTVDFANGQKQKLTLTGNCAITVTAPGVGNYQLQLYQDGTGNRTATWAASSGSVGYIGSATAPQLNTPAGSETVISLIYDGTNFRIAGGKVGAP